MGDDAFDPKVWKRATELFEASLRRDRPAGRRNPAALSIALLDPAARSALIRRARDELSRESERRATAGQCDEAAQARALIRLFRRLEGNLRAPARRK